MDKFKTVEVKRFSNTDFVAILVEKDFFKSIEESCKSKNVSVCEQLYKLLDELRKVKS